jgi:hypothetical protein
LPAACNRLFLFRVLSSHRERTDVTDAARERRTTVDATDEPIAEATPQPEPTACAGSSRRSFLEGIARSAAVAAVTSIAVATSAGAAAAGEEARRSKRSVRVFRFQTRTRRSCRACELHHRYKIFLTRKDARRHRAHPGCDCPVVPQWISKRSYRRLFIRSGALERGYVDLRA